MKSGFWPLITFVSAFYLIGFAMLGSGLWSAWRSTSAGSWPKTPGRLAELSLKTNMGSGKHGGPTHGVHVRYTYKVDNVAYEGSRLAFGYASSSNWRAHNEIYQKLKNAKVISVRYAPADHSVSCLSFGVHQSIRFLLIFSITWLAVCICFTCLGYLAGGDDRVLLENLSVE